MRFKRLQHLLQKSNIYSKFLLTKMEQQQNEVACVGFGNVDLPSGDPHCTLWFSGETQEGALGKESPQGEGHSSFAGWMWTIVIS